jgi:hypothetical protein
MMKILSVMVVRLMQTEHLAMGRLLSEHRGLRKTMNDSPSGCSSSSTGRGGGRDVLVAALKNGLLYSASASALYMIVVAATTPNLPALDSIRIAAGVNWWIFAGSSLGVGAQIFLVTYAKEKACDIRSTVPLSGATGMLSAFASFLSYLALIPLGCCGTWLYILSFLPGILGVGASAMLIEDSRIIAAIGLASMALSVLYTYLSLRRRLV